MRGTTLFPPECVSRPTLSERVAVPNEQADPSHERADRSTGSLDQRDERIETASEPFRALTSSSPRRFRSDRMARICRRPALCTMER